LSAGQEVRGARGGLEKKGAGRSPTDEFFRENNARHGLFRTTFASSSGKLYFYCRICLIP
jgi:hypothetical protein